jgi:glucan phosphoethanolaminetransferase (alkaline phosphatase superfamily)
MNAALYGYSRKTTPINEGGLQLIAIAAARHL